ncbi:uncharacterized protein BYT42DRAFT_561393 [Radiomyces spectabilis]|uniref:uncharacterized protein n=1 Tax=Radiomyces spectabilis TaxID=64574 RepID=UPI00221FCDF0|nr:uncharacterized protein BYT42DRAFT_561393 [Radiomyces spectabilis]KAI8388832.1 hypothetical protein BYT42DRAFT_561393 [Radiomyces spectabilis]
MLRVVKKKNSLTYYQVFVGERRVISTWIVPAARDYSAFSTLWSRFNCYYYYLHSSDSPRLRLPVPGTHSIPSVHNAFDWIMDEAYAEDLAQHFRPTTDLSNNPALVVSPSESSDDGSNSEGENEATGNYIERLYRRITSFITYMLVYCAAWLRRRFFPLIP